MNIENIIWFQELKLIALLYRYFYLSYHKQTQERNWKDIAIKNQIYDIQKEYNKNYEQLRNDAISSMERSRNDYNILLKSLQDTQNKLADERKEKTQLNAQINENLQTTNLLDLKNAIHSVNDQVKNIQDKLTDDNRDLTNERESLIKDNDGLKKKNTELETKLMDIESKLNELQNSNEELNQRLQIADGNQKQNISLELADHT